MKNCLENLTIAVTGDFGLPRSHEDLKRSIKNNGGTFAEHISDTVTHLICSKEHWKKQHSTVKEALCYKDIKIVSYDWLEDSLLSKRARKESKKYMMKSVVAKKKKEKAAKRHAIKEAVKTINKGCKEAKNDILSDRYHIYRDETGFDYDVILVRSDLSKNQNERHHLKLYESNAIPHLYCTYTRYSRPGLGADQDLTPLGSLFHLSFAAFTKFFKAKTGLLWEQRLDDIKGEGDDVFTYTPPVLGRPRGRMPHYWKPPSQVVDLEDEGASEGCVSDEGYCVSLGGRVRGF